MGIPSKPFLVFVIALLLVFVLAVVTVDSKNPRQRNNSDMRNLWNPNNSLTGRYSIPSPPSHGSPRIDYETGYATGVAMNKALGLTKIVLSPIVIPMVFFVGIVLLVFFAVVGSSAVVGNALGRRRGQIGQQHYRPSHFAKTFSDSTAKLASDVLSSDQCIERLSCELFRKARTMGAENLIMSAIQEMPSSEGVIGRVSRSAKTANCHKFSCSSLSVVSRAMKALQG